MVIWTVTKTASKTSNFTDNFLLNFLEIKSSIRIFAKTFRKTFFKNKREWVRQIAYIKYYNQTTFYLFAKLCPFVWLYFTQKDKTKAPSCLSLTHQVTNPLSHFFTSPSLFTSLSFSLFLRRVGCQKFPIIPLILPAHKQYPPQEAGQERSRIKKVEITNFFLA